LERAFCNLCGADKPRVVYTNFGRDISRCGSCGHLYAGPARLTGWETWTQYDERFFENEYLPTMGVVDGQFDLEAFDARYSQMLDRLRPHRRLGTLLDVGCGAGFFLKSAERDGWRVSGIEVMPHGAEFARTRLGLDVVSTPIEDANLSPAAFDVIVMFDVIEHLADPVGVVGRLGSLLRPGGWLAIITPNIGSLTHAMLGGLWCVLNPSEHLHYFSEASLRRMLIARGYDSVHFDRHYAGDGVYETMLPSHNSNPASRRARFYTWLFERYGHRLRGPVQSLGLADALHCMARRPTAP
jgi:2-polyprenyl-3-methyl-5-hydroxy-6-metoxy-1,4-benzoquinol methylase